MKPKQRNTKKEIRTTITRLKHVVRVAKNLPDYAKIRMGDWWYCRTTACIAGWCGQDPWFRERGFKTRKSGDNSTVILRPKNRTLNTSFGACRDFFGLDADRPLTTAYDAFTTGDEVEYLFGPSAYKNPPRKI